MKKTITYKEIKDKVLDIINNGGGGGGSSEYTSVLHTPVSGGANTVFAIDSIANAKELIIVYAYDERGSDDKGFTHMNTTCIDNVTLNYIKSVYNKNGIGLIDGGITTSVTGSGTKFNAYWGLKFTSNTSAVIILKNVDGWTANQCCIKDICIR